MTPIFSYGAQGHPLVEIDFQELWARPPVAVNQQPSYLSAVRTGPALSPLSPTLLSLSLLSLSRHSTQSSSRGGGRRRRPRPCSGRPCRRGLRDGGLRGGVAGGAEEWRQRCEVAGRSGRAARGGGGAAAATRSSSAHLGRSRERLAGCAAADEPRLPPLVLPGAAAGEPRLPPLVLPGAAAGEPRLPFSLLVLLACRRGESIGGEDKRVSRSARRSATAAGTAAGSRRPAQQRGCGPAGRGARPRRAVFLFFKSVSRGG